MLLQKKQGGIQKGTTASSVKSTKLDNQLKTIAKLIANDVAGYEEGHRKTNQLFEHVLTGCVPDGGLWLDYHKKVRVAFEGKYQGNHGNAHERHSKNYLIAKKHGGDSFKYITFMTGAGAALGGVLDTYARTMLYCENESGYDEINVTHPKGFSFYLSEDGFTDEQIETIMRAALA